MINFLVASHSPAVLENNLLRSPIVKTSDNYLTILQGFTNIPKAYNHEKLAGVVVYVHHDVFLPITFEADLKRALVTVPDDWGVLGVAGVRLVSGKKEIYGYISDRGKPWGSPNELPAEVDTLDEMLLITRGDVIFDEQFEQDFYGADICMQARLQGLKCYAINAYCEHNSSRPPGGRTEKFYEAEKRFRAKYIDHLPIGTTCSMLS